MPAVNVQDSAHTDPRLTACAKALRMSRPTLLVACMQLWSRVLAQGHARMRAELVAGALGRKVPQVTAVLGLYEIGDVSDGVVDLAPLGDLFGARHEAPAAGKPGKEQARRERHEREVLDAIGAKTLERQEIASMVKRRKSVTLDLIRSMLETGVIEEVGSGIRVPVPVPVPVGNQDSGSGSGSAPSPFSPPTPPSYTPTPENNTHRAGACEAGSGQQPVTSSPGSGVYGRLYERWSAVVARRAPPGAVRDLGSIAVLHTIRETVQHPLLRDQPPEELERALDLLGVQCQAKADAGEDDPWWLLRSAWQPRVLADALAMPDEKTARTRATRGRSGPRGRNAPRPGVKSAPNEAYETKGIGECEI